MADVRNQRARCVSTRKDRVILLLGMAIVMVDVGIWQRFVRNAWNLDARFVSKRKVRMLIILK
jgi:hypothetical protein